MGRKKRPAEERDDEVPRRRRRSDDDSDSSDDSIAPRKRNHYEIDPDIQELAYSFKIDEALTQKLNDIMIEDRQRTWEQDIARLYEILKDARTPSAMLNLKLKDMESGTFIGKAKCAGKVEHLARKHKLDKGAATKLEEAMSMREAMGKSVDRDLALLDEHLAASNKPSALVSMKLDVLRRGLNLGHCIYSREDPLPGNQSPGVDGVFDKRSRRTLGYTDADLDKRFAAEASGNSGGVLMDEAAARRMITAERARREESIRQKRKLSCSRSRSGARRRRGRMGSQSNSRDRGVRGVDKRTRRR
eukprot:TRINITY_DN64670_c0_g1_i1.p1 TRINITY_DN64670_c0_g1~~TRINITY_DN64670_c0_g1_i1.p1  ORF type:complete len:303 (-),score=62.54 TRINITY_DN64670_c0_g1_i1:171-1079(-)